MMGTQRVNPDGRTETLEENLIAAFTPAQIQTLKDQFGAGAGGELERTPPHQPSLHSAYSSAALCVNTFAPFLGREQELGLASAKGFESLAFEAKLPIFRGGTPPHLDLVARDGENVAIESKCTEFLDVDNGEFSLAYERPEAQGLLHPSWRERYLEVRDAPTAYGALNAHQLIKHYLGIKKNLPGLRTTLLYLYWEPENRDEFPGFAEHRDELKRFGAGLEDPEVLFQAQSYPELWEGWIESKMSEWVADHVAALRRRYLIRI